MSHPKPSQIWEAIFPTSDNSDIVTRSLLILSAPSEQKTCLVTPLLASKPDEPKYIQIDKECFQGKKPTHSCFINPFNIYPMDIVLFIAHSSELHSVEFDHIRQTITDLMKTQ